MFGRTNIRPVKNGLYCCYMCGNCEFKCRLKGIKGIWSEDANWPENVENVQTHLSAGFLWIFHHYPYTKNTILLLIWASQGTTILVHSLPMKIAQEPCESRGGRPGLYVPNKPLVSVDVKQHWTKPMKSISLKGWLVVYFIPFPPLNTGLVYDVTDTKCWA